MKQKYANPPNRYVWRYGSKYYVSWRGGVPYITFDRNTRVLYEYAHTGDYYINFYDGRIYFQD